MTKQLREVYFAALLTVISFMLAVQSFNYPPDSSDFPRFLTVLMTVFAAALTCKSYLKLKEEQTDNVSFKELFEKQKMSALVFLGTIIYVVGIKYIGYFSSSIIFLIGSMAFFSKKRNWKVMVLSTIGFLLVVYALFVWFLNLRMPQGLLM